MSQPFDASRSLGCVLRAVGKLAESRAAPTSSLTLGPAQLSAWLTLANVELALDDKPASERALLEILARLQFKEALRQALFLIGDFAPALKAYEKALVASPDDVGVIQKHARAPALAGTTRAGVVDRDIDAAKTARSTASSSARNVSSLAVSKRATCRFEITTPMPSSLATMRSCPGCRLTRTGNMPPHPCTPGASRPVRATYSV